MIDMVAHPEAQGFVGVFDSGVGGISVLQHLVRELPHEDFRFFGDSAQSIMGFGDRGETQTIERTASDMGIAPDPLYFNYRLTKEVAALGESVGEVDDLVIKCKRQGEKPNLIQANSFDGQLDKIIDIIKNRSLTNVGILLPFNTEDKGGEWSVEYVKNY